MIDAVDAIRDVLNPKPGGRFDPQRALKNLLKEYPSLKSFIHPAGRGYVKRIAVDHLIDFFLQLQDIFWKENSIIRTTISKIIGHAPLHPKELARREKVKAVWKQVRLKHSLRLLF